MPLISTDLGLYNQKLQIMKSESETIIVMKRELIRNETIDIKTKIKTNEL